jgi:hypothetical protein
MMDRQDSYRHRGWPLFICALPIVLRSASKRGLRQVARGPQPYSAALRTHPPKVIAEQPIEYFSLPIRITRIHHQF